MGRGRLYELFSITNPAFAAEMAQLLSRPEYADPTTQTSLDIVEIVKYLLRGTVEYVPSLRRGGSHANHRSRDRIICDALGCPIDSLANCSAPPLDSSKDWLLGSLEPMARLKQASISDADSIHDQVQPTRFSGRCELVEENRDVHDQICDRQEPTEDRQDTHVERCEYDWDNGPLELLPLDLAETDYDPDRGPYSPGAFFVDESDPVLGLFSTHIMS